MKKQMFFILMVLAAMALIAGCKKDENPVNPPGGPTTTTFTGVFSNTTEAGRLTLEVPTAKVSAGDTILISGKIFLATGDTVVLSGFYVQTTGQIHVEGGGYVLDGFYADGKITGSYTGPNGNGGFTVRESSGENSILVYCGTSTEDPPGTDTGRFTMIIDGTVVTVMVNGEFPLSGTLEGTTITIYHPEIPSLVIATGTLTGGGASGTYNTGDSQGTWTASPCE